jgi:hypothetical protein
MCGQKNSSHRSLFMVLEYATHGAKDKKSWSAQAIQLGSGLCGSREALNSWVYHTYTDAVDLEHIKSGVERGPLFGSLSQKTFLSMVNKSPPT